MVRQFIETTFFTKRWNEMGLNKESKSMEKDLFDDLIAALNEAIEHEKGNIHLKTTVLEIPDEEIERNQLFLQSFDKLPELYKQKAIKYVDDLLRLSV